MKLELLCKAAGIICPPKAYDLEITEIVTNSQHVTKGCMFVCIRGTHTDGHRYIADAVRQGAVCILTDRYEPHSDLSGVAVLSCADTRRAAAYLFHAWYDLPGEKLKLIAVTGTNGKTSTVHILSQILRTCGYRVGVIGTLGCYANGQALEIRSADPTANMTTPDPQELYHILSEMQERDVEYVVMEASSHALELEKLAPLTFAVGIFTGLSPEHLDFHGNMERYARAKARLFSKSNITICNADSSYADLMASHAKGKCIMVSPYRGEGEVCATNVVYSPGGVRYRLRSLSTHLGLYCPLPGKFTLQNSMLAALAALALGCRTQEVQSALADMPPVPGRMEQVMLGKDADITVIIDYAHTPDALEKALQSLREIAGEATRLSVLFGCGGDRDREKRPVMGAIAARMCDRVILTSDNPRTEEPEEILKEILVGVPQGSDHIVIQDRREAIRYAILSALPGEILLLSGKGHETYELIKQEKRPFSEREIATEAYIKRCQKKEGNAP